MLTEVAPVYAQGSFRLGVLGVAVSIPIRLLISVLVGAWCIPAPVSAQDDSITEDEVIITGSRVKRSGRWKPPISEVSFFDLMVNGGFDPNFFFSSFGQTLNVGHTEGLTFGLGTPIGAPTSSGAQPIIRLDLSYLQFTYDGHTNTNGSQGASSGRGNLTYAGVGPGIVTALGARTSLEATLTVGGAFGGVSGTFEADIGGFAARGRTAIMFDAGNGSTFGVSASAFQVFGDHGGGVTGGVRSPFRQDKPSFELGIFYRRYLGR